MRFNKGWNYYFVQSQIYFDSFFSHLSVTKMQKNTKSGREKILFHNTVNYVYTGKQSTDLGGPKAESSGRGVRPHSVLQNQSTVFSQSKIMASREMA